MLNNTSASPLANLRNVRLSLQKQEQVLVQKFHSETLNQITKLMTDADLSLDDLEHHISTIKLSTSKLKRLEKKKQKSLNSANKTPVTNSQSLNSQENKVTTKT